jgi:phage-related protein
MRPLKEVRFYPERLRGEMQLWSKDHRARAGFLILCLQKGGFPSRKSDWDWWHDCGTKVMELRVLDCRVIVTLEHDDPIWVIHVYEKDAAENNETRKRHKDTVKLRVKQLQATLKKST